MKSFKVLFFDSWKGGISHFIRLINSLNVSGIEAMMIHLGSWGHESKLLLEENIDGMLIRDIKYYGHYNFEKILEIEQPDLVLFLSSHTFAHRAFNRYCRKMCIPTILLMHGLVSYGFDDSVGKNSVGKVNWLNQIKRVLSSTPKLIKFVLPCYIRALYKTKANRNDWLMFARNIYFLASNPSKALYMTEDSKTTKGLVYTDADKIVLTSQYGFRDADLIEVGNPDLITFNVTSEMLGTFLDVPAYNKQYVMYIGTAFWAVGYYFTGINDYIEYLLHINQIIIEQGKRFIFKPHPELNRYPEKVHYLKSRNVEIVENNNFVSMLANCCAVIGETSSLSLIPSILGLPMFYVKYGPLKDASYEQFFMSYPRARLLTDPKKFIELLEAESRFIDTDAVRRWISSNVGILPAEDMPSRVVKVIMSLISTVDRKMEKEQVINLEESNRF